jgi:hypothetical protein
MLDSSSSKASTKSSKCKQYAKSLSEALSKSPTKSIDLKACGTRENNVLVAFLRCEAKAATTACSSVLKSYDTCHKSIMGIGVFSGQRDCEAQLVALQECVNYKA